MVIAVRLDRAMQMVIATKKFRVIVLQTKQRVLALENAKQKIQARKDIAVEYVSIQNLRPAR